MKNNKYIRTLAILFLTLIFVLNQFVCLPLSVVADSLESPESLYGTVACYDEYFTYDTFSAVWKATGSGEVSVDKEAIHVDGSEGAPTLTRYFDDAGFLRNIDGRLLMDVTLVINSDASITVRARGNNPRGINLEFKFKSGNFTINYKDTDGSKKSTSVKYTSGEPFRFCVDFEAGLDKKMSVWAGSPDNPEPVITDKFTYGGYKSIYECAFIGSTGCNFDVLNYSILNLEEPLSEAEALQYACDKLDLKYLTTESADEITEDINLITDFMLGTKVSWESSDEEVITPEGIITRQAGIDALATLTATLELNGNTVQKEFDVEVLRRLDSDSDVIERLETYLEMSRFTTEEPHRLTEDLNLPLEYRGAVIEWTCEPNIVNHRGRLTRSLEDVSAVLTANFSKGDCSGSKSFDITVLKTLYIDPMHMSDEEFFGIWDSANECWELESRIDYDYSEKLLPVEEKVKTGDYSGAKKELLQYYRDKAPSMPQVTERDRKAVNYFLDNIYGGTILDEQSVPLEYSHVTFGVPTGTVSKTNTMIFMLMGRKKDAGYVEFYSKEQGSNAPVLEVLVNGEYREFPIVADSYIRPGDYLDTNFGSSDVIEVKDSGAPYDDESRRGYLVFDTSSLKDGDVVGSGKITLYGKSVAPDAKGVMLVAGGSAATWTEETLTWKSIVGDIYSWQGINGGTDWNLPKYAQNQYHYILARMNHLRPLAGEYKVTGDERYARAAITSMVDFIVDKGDEPGPDPRFLKGVGGWPRTLDAGLRADRTVPTYYTVVTSESMNETANMAILKDFWRLANCLANEDNFNSDHNWGGSETKGMYTVAKYFPEFTASTQKTDVGENSPWLPLAINRMEQMMGGIVYEDGSYEECSSSYTEGQYNTNHTMIQQVIRNGDEFSPEFMEKFHKFTYYLFDLHTPAGSDVVWGDSSGSTRGSDYKSDVIQMYDDSELDYIATFGMQGKAPDYTSIKYEGSRTVFLRSGWNKNALYTFMNTKGGHGAHSHADDLHMTVAAYGRTLLCDTGTYSYVYDHPMRLWIESTRGHNTIEINGVRQLNRNKVGSKGGMAGDENAQLGDIEEFITTDSFDFVKMSTPNNPGFKHTRNVLFVRPDYWIVSDYITPEDKSLENTYRQFWHTRPDANAGIDNVSKSFFTNYETGANIMVTPADKELIEAQVLQGYVNPPTTNKYAEYTKTGKGDMTFDTVLYPSPDQKKHAVGVRRLELSDGAPASEATALKISIVDEANQSASTTAYYYMAQEDKYKAERGFGDFKTDGTLSYVEYNTQNRLSNIFIKGGNYIEDTKNGRFVVSGVKENDIGIRWEGNTLIVDSTSEEPDVGGMQIYSDIGVHRVVINGKDVDYYQDNGVVYLSTSEGSSSSDQAAGNSKPPSSDKKPGGSGGSGGSSFVPVVPVPDIPPSIENKISFEDVNNHWAKEDIEYLASKNIVNGYDGLFMPENKVTRAEFAAMIVRALELETSDYGNSFSDVTSDDWFAPYVQTAFNNGLISGYSEGVFGPSDPITREQAAKILVSALEKASGAVAETDSLNFTDVNQISDWALESVGKAAMTEILKGDDTGAFKPQNNASRAETAAMIRRLLAKLQ